jgi:glycosyltransferase involved in cell wall biosynthesis
MNRRIAYLISRYPAVSHTFILREVVELRKLGFEIEVASVNSCDRPAEKLAAEERGEMQKTWYIKRQGISGALSALAAVAFSRPVSFLRGAWFALRLGGSDIKRIVLSVFYFVEAVMLGRWMKSRGLTHLHVHFATPASSVGLVMTRIFPHTLSIMVHGPDEFYDVPGNCLPQKIAGARFLCTIGFYAKSQLMRIASADQWAKMFVTPLGVDPDLFTPRPFRESPEVFEIICVGRLVPAKGQHVLLDAVARLIRQGKPVRLRIVGDGPDRASLEQSAREKNLGASVVFEGSVNQDRIRDLYAQADVFALASFAEGIPVVLMEAMAMEIPCVTTWITGVPELIRDGVDGLLVPPADIGALADSLARLRDDPALRRRVGAAGRARVIDKYNLRPSVARLGEVFQERLFSGRSTGAST